MPPHPRLHLPLQKHEERVARLRAILALLKKKYPVIQSEMRYETPMQFVACVILSAQFTDKGVNRLTETLWKKYRTLDDFANVSPDDFAKEIHTVSYFNSKAKYIVATARMIRDEYGGVVPREKALLLRCPGVGSKTANVILSELYAIGSGIAVDVHVQRFVYRFDLSDARTPAGIERELCALVPEEEWRYVNHCLVMYGRHECPARRHACEHHTITHLYPPANTRWRSTVRSTRTHSTRSA